MRLRKLGWDTRLRMLESEKFGFSRRWGYPACRYSVLCLTTVLAKSLFHGGVLLSLAVF